MRSYHKHTGVKGSHKISTSHEKPAARRAHLTELQCYNKLETKITPKKTVPKQATTITLPVNEVKGERNDG